MCVCPGGKAVLCKYHHGLRILRFDACTIESILQRPSLDHMCLAWDRPVWTKCGEYSLCLLEKDGHLGVPGSEDEPRRIVCPAMNHFLPPHRNCIPWGRDAGLSGWRNDCNYIPFYYCCFRDTLYAVKQNQLDGE